MHETTPLPPYAVSRLSSPNRAEPTVPTISGSSQRYSFAPRRKKHVPNLQLFGIAFDYRATEYDLPVYNGGDQPVFLAIFIMERRTMSAYETENSSVPNHSGRQPVRCFYPGTRGLRHFPESGRRRRAGSISEAGEFPDPAEFFRRSTCFDSVGQRRFLPKILRWNPTLACPDKGGTCEIAAGGFRLP